MVKLVMGAFRKELMNLVAQYLNDPTVEALRLDEFLSETFFK
jgi:hypothetical protein